METMRLGRNDLCRCGSGKKFKKCCLTRQPPPASPSLGRVSSPPRGGSQPASDGIPEYVIVKGKGSTHRSKLRPGDECELKDGSWAIYRPDLMDGGSVHVKGKGWIPERELKPGDQYEYNGVWVTFQPERVIGTTEEHPFYVYGKGWTPLREIRLGDLIRTEDGWVPVGKIENTGRFETVYNLRVEDYHTYFVGAPEWGFAVWAHNTCYPTDAAGRQRLADALTAAGFKPTQGLSKMRKADIEQIAAAMTKDADAFWAGVSPFKKVIIGPGGEVMDGHHRVIASVLSGKPIPASHIFRFPGANQRPVFNWIDVLPH